jgi:hypothetical protein
MRLRLAALLSLGLASADAPPRTISGSGLVAWSERELRRVLSEPSAIHVVDKDVHAHLRSLAPHASSHVVLCVGAACGAYDVVDRHESSHFFECAAVRAGVSACVVVGGDASGLAYGVLALLDAARVHAEALRAVSPSRRVFAVALPSSFTHLPTRSSAPSIEKRGLKFNVPLDGRTPSYDDCGDNAQSNLKSAVWDMTFWAAYFDAMVRMRMNALSLWTPHPYLSLIKSVPGYPGLAGYEDVYAPTLDMAAFHPNCDTNNYGANEQWLASLEKVFTLSIDDKISFFQNVTSLAVSLGIEVAVVTWSDFSGYAHQGGDSTNATADYHFAAVTEFLETYPDVSLGITAGENMTIDDKAKEAWCWKGYGQAVNAVLAKDPARPLRLIHRVWETVLDDILQAFAGLDKNLLSFDFAFKYCAGRCWTTTTPKTWANANITLPPGTYSRFWWNMRNDDVYTYRWGDVEFVRQLLAGLPDASVTRGLWLGSDGWVWGREFTSLAPSSPRALEVDKHFLVHSAMGILAYNNATPAAVFDALAGEAYPEAPSGAYVTNLSAAASKVVPLVSSFYWQQWDFMWNVETCATTIGGVNHKNDSMFVSVLDFFAHSPLPGSGMMSIADFVKNPSGPGMTPLQVAAQLDGIATATLAGVAGAGNPGSNAAFKEALGDYTAFAYMGSYYANKIRGATYYALFLSGKDPSARAESVKNLQAASTAWAMYAEATYAQYSVVVTFARTGNANLTAILSAVQNDVNLVGGP